MQNVASLASQIPPVTRNRKPFILCPVSSQSPAALKEEGNALFKAGDLPGAVCCYTKALNLSDSQSESAVLHRNRSACYLKLEEYSEAAADATKGARPLLPARCRVKR